MLVYEGDKQQFLSDVQDNSIDQKIEMNMWNRLHKRVSSSEEQSWRNSLNYMQNVLLDSEIPDTSGVAIEFGIPNTNKRVDFILTGLDKENQHNAVIVELKQWSKVEPVPYVDQLLEAEIIDVQTRFSHGQQVVHHPSYQAWSYRSLISNFNVNVHAIPIHLESCAYLHNYVPPEDDPLKQHYFQSLLDESPVFYRSDVMKLREFIKKYIHTGDAKQTLYYIDDGEIRPSKSLQDALSAMLRGKEEFILIDEQKIVYEQMLSFARRSKEDGKKRVFIVQGGPGTGKTVVAINLLVQLINDDQVCAYVTKNSAPRKVFEAKLRSGAFKRNNISSLFKGSTAFVNADTNDFGTLIVDEAHRLNKRSQQGLKVTGEDQIKEIINASRCSVFFIDEDQRVTAQDYGDRAQILYWAKAFNAEVQEGRLLSQFRCNGSDGYLSWLDGVLGIQEETANPTLEGIDYDFRVVENPHELRRLIEERNREDDKARIVAGYCWDWVSKNNPDSVPDITIDDFSMYWNLSSDGTYAISKGSINQVGCIHTTQGLEFSYVGVIIGDDLRFEKGNVISDYTKRARTDQSLKGLKGPIKKGDQEAMKTADIIIRNTYRTLMSRGMKGCYVYCTNKELAHFLKTRIAGYREEGESPLLVAEREK
ncbi:DNA/RNA helicase domain-containing protein [uncultured Sphaerochaeta sp.]|uniref:DNA/RNA helicase domain-containing protein n=1 Tax=uncultured Sphaerochaeta sp. TaxID=886478 RepID=UPI002AA92E5C|nr:DNA/RNA helicase domain-containing protein [uncultured Sphaerochaeta sp.]